MLQSIFTKSPTQINKNPFGKKVGLFVKFFGCWHKHLTRPFSHNDLTYRRCTNCGAVRQFDNQKFATFGGYYYLSNEVQR